MLRDDVWADFTRLIGVPLVRPSPVGDIVIILVDDVAVILAGSDLERFNWLMGQWRNSPESEILHLEDFGGWVAIKVGHIRAINFGIR